MVSARVLGGVSAGVPGFLGRAALLRVLWDMLSGCVLGPVQRTAEGTREPVLLLLTHKRISPGRAGG